MSRPARAAAAAALLAASTVLALGTGELLARRWPGYPPQPRYYPGERVSRPCVDLIPDPYAGWRLRPGCRFLRMVEGRPVMYRANAQGFRADTDFDSTESRPAVVFIGDSFTFGAGVDADSTFVALVQRAFPDLAVYNLGLPGYGFDQMWMTVRHHAGPLRPRLIVVGFIDEDLARSQTAFRAREGFTKPRFLLDGDALRPATLADRPPRLVRGVARRSWLVGACQAAEARVGMLWPVGGWWSLNAAIARAIVADAARLGASVLFVRMPRRTPQPPFPTFQALAAELGAGCLDLADAATRRPPGIHFPHDAHLNEAGHRFVADTLVRWIGAHRDRVAPPGPVVPPTAR